MKNCRFALFIAAMLSLAAASIAAATPPKRPNYHFVRRIVLRGTGTGGWDYMTLDSAGRRLYVTNSSHVFVVDPDSGKTIGSIPNTQGVHGVALDHKLGLGFASDGRADSVTTFNLRTAKIVRVTSGTGKNPDCIVYDPASRDVFTFNGHSDSSTVIDAASGKIITTIPLGGRPEFAVADGKGNIFDNITDKNQLIRIDTRNMTVVNRWPLGCTHSTGLSMDYKNRRLFAGCRGHMQILNADTGQVIKSLPIGEGVDATRYDPGTKLAFASTGGVGAVTVVRELSPDDFEVVQTIKTQVGARTMALDQKTHNIFVVTAKLAPPGPATPENPRPRPRHIPNTPLIVLEYAP